MVVSGYVGNVVPTVIDVKTRFLILNSNAPQNLQRSRVDLDRGVVARPDDPVGGGAFSGNVKIDVFCGFVLHLEIF